MLLDVQICNIGVVIAAVKNLRYCSKDRMQKSLPRLLPKDRKISGTNKWATDVIYTQNHGVLLTTLSSLIIFKKHAYTYRCALKV
jgi:hypothetical protein